MIETTLEGHYNNLIIFSIHIVITMIKSSKTYPNAVKPNPFLLSDNRIKYNNRELHIYEYPQPIAVFQYVRCDVILHLSVVNCNLRTLEGIEMFTAVDHVDLRGNNIEDGQQIGRVSRTVRILDFRDNPVENKRECMWDRLREDYLFENLVQLNGKDYQHILHKSHVISMNKVLKKAERQQKQWRRMQKIAKRKGQLNVCPDRYPTDRQYPTAYKHCKPTLHTQMTQIPYAVTKRNASPQSPYQQSSGKKQFNQWEKSIRANARINTSPDKQNIAINAYCNSRKNNNDTNNNYYADGDADADADAGDHSLGNISNVPLVRSMRASKAKNKSLKIVTMGVDPVREVNQPTATFALQRERQIEAVGSEGSFVFSKTKTATATAKTKTKFYKQEEYIEQQPKQYAGFDELIQGQAQAPSFQPLNSDSSISSAYSRFQSNSPLLMERKSINTRRKDIPRAFYYINLRRKVFDALKEGIRAKNMPRKTIFS